MAFGSFLLGWELENIFLIYSFDLLFLPMYLQYLYICMIFYLIPVINSSQRQFLKFRRLPLLLGMMVATCNFSLLFLFVPLNFQHNLNKFPQINIRRTKYPLFYISFKLFLHPWIFYLLNYCILDNQNHE